MRRIPIFVGCFVALLECGGQNPQASTWSGQCPDPLAAPPQFYAYQSDVGTVELVIASSALQGADHYEIRRSKVGTAEDTQLVPQNISPATPSIIDRNQGLQDVSLIWGAPEPYPRYVYTLTVYKTAVTRASYPAPAVDIATDPPTPLGPPTPLELPLGHRFGPADYGPVRTDDVNGDGKADFPLSQPPYYSGFPAPWNRTYAKYIGTARDRKTTAVLACAQVSVVDSKTGTRATLYADRYGRYPHPNPVFTDRHGRFEFHADHGVYDIQVAAGPSSYVHPGVTLYDPRGAHTATAEGDKAAFTMVTSSAPSNGEGNVSVRYFRGLHPSHRLLTNDAVHAWALTYNASWNEQARAWSLNIPDKVALFARVNRESVALEYGLDQAYGITNGADWVFRPTAQFETFVHIGLDRAHVKSTQSPVTIEAIAGEANLGAGIVVRLNDDLTVSRMDGREPYPFLLWMVHEPDGVTRVGSRVYLVIAGRLEIDTGTDTTYQPGDVFVGGGPYGLAQRAVDETDSGYILGYARSRTTRWVHIDVR